jgi:hypothetical protein
MSIYQPRNRHKTENYFFLRKSLPGMSRMRFVHRLPCESAATTSKMEGAEDMKYILLMTGTKAGVDAYKSWSEKDIQTHFAHLKSINKELSESGEFVANEGLAAPDQAKLVHAGKDGMPITDGVFPEAKEFLLGYWMVDVDHPQRAYEIASRLSAYTGPGGVPSSMPIEVRQIMSHRTEELP